MQESRSKKHHYLPRYFLKGFTNPNGSFFVYDKQTRKIFKSSPDNSFFENNLNTVTLKHGDSDFIEKMYSNMEGKFWKSLDTIRDSTYQMGIGDLDKMNLYLFLAILHWRLPKNMALVESLSKRFFTGDNDFKYITLKSKTNKNVPEEIVDEFRSSEGFKKSAKLLIPFINFQGNEWYESVANWTFSYTGDNARWHMIGDSPILTEGIYDEDPKKFLDRFMFPVSGSVMLINNGTHITPKELPEAFLLQFNTALVHKAERFVACPNKDLLEVIIRYYYNYVSNDMTHLIFKELFSYLDDPNPSY